MKPSKIQQLASRLLLVIGILSVVAAVLWLLRPSKEPPFEPFIALLSGIAELLTSFVVTKLPLTTPSSTQARRNRSMMLQRVHNH